MALFVIISDVLVFASETDYSQHHASTPILATGATLASNRVYLRSLVVSFGSIPLAA